MFDFRNGVPLNQSQQLRGRQLSHKPEWTRNSRQTWGQQLRDDATIEPDYRKFIGHRDAKFRRDLDHASSHNIVSGKYRCGSRAARKQLLKFLEAWGFADPASVAARRKLSTLLFS